MLVRRYVGKQLAEYFSQPSSKVVGSHSLCNVPFSSLLGEWHWRRVYQRMYEQQEGQWLTPVELFRPYYSQILANFVAATTTAHEKIHVVELGGGRGTNATILLSHLQNTQPQLYDRLSYTIVDSSPTLHELQKEVIESGIHRDKVDFLLKDLSDVAENTVSFLDESDIRTTVIALELLDNLPHDKIRRSKTTRELEQAEVDHTAIVDNVDSIKHRQLTEVFVPITDGLLLKVLEKVPMYGGKSGRPTWVPSVACGVLERVVTQRPNSQLLIADFDWLPPPDVVANPLRRSTLAEGEPLVTAMDDTDYDCFLECPSFCDILFPTNFDRLASFIEKTWDATANVKVMKQSAFLQEHGRSEVDATKSWLTGYSPLIHDFGNCSILSVTQNKS